MSALVLKGVHKAYGKIQALNGLDLEIPKGVVCGLVGPNGAGKTTTFGVVGGYVRADSGSISLLGQGPFDPAIHRGRVALLPQDCELNPHMPVRESLEFLARLQGMDRKSAVADTDRVLELVDLRDRAQMKIRQLSHGMRRRVSVAQAFLGSPELVLLDEPTAGLDPDQVMRLRTLFLSQKGKCTLVISSHVLAELEQSCDYVVRMEAGRCVQAGDMDQVTQRRSMVRVQVQGDAQAAAELLAAFEPKVQGEEIILRCPVGVAPESLNAQILPILLANQVKLLQIRTGESLEAALLK